MHSRNNENGLLWFHSILLLMFTLGNSINYILMLCFLLVPTTIWINHFHPFIAMKEFLFVVSVFVSSGLFLGSMIFAKRVAIRKSRLSFAVGIYYGYNVFSFMVFPYTDQAYFFSFTCLILLFFIVSTVTDLHARNRIIQTLIVVAIITSVYGVFQFFNKDLYGFSYYFGTLEFSVFKGARIFATFGHPNLLGGFFVFMLPLIGACFAANLRARKYYPAYYFGAVFLLAILTLFLSRTRGSWIAAGCALGGLGIFLLKNQLRRIFKQHLLLAYGLLFFLAGGIVGGLTMLRMRTVLLDPMTWQFRLNYYRETLRMIQERPLLGRGLGTFNVYYPLYHDQRRAFQLGEVESEYRVEHPHNEHLEILHDGGVIGYGLFLWIIAEAGYRLLQKKTLLEIGLAMSLFGLVCDGLLSQNLRFIVIASLFWLALGFSNIPDTLPKQPSAHNLPGISIVQLSGLVIVIGFVGLFIYIAYQRMQADYYLKGGMSHYAAQNFPEAISWFTEVLTRDHHNKRAWYYLADSYRSMSDNEHALQAYTQLLVRDPNFLQANYYLGALYVQKNDVQHAQYYFGKQIMINNMHWKAYYNLAMLSLYLDQREEARHYCQEVKHIHAIKAIDQESLGRINQLLAQL